MSAITRSTEKQQAQAQVQAILDLAEQLGEDPARLRQRKDIAQVLQMMGQGVIADLKIARPRFTKTLRPEDLGEDLEEIDSIEASGSTGRVNRRQVRR